MVFAVLVEGQSNNARPGFWLRREDDREFERDVSAMLVGTGVSMMRMAMWVLVLAWGAACGQEASAKKATEAMASSVMKAWPNGIVATTAKPGQWGYEEGVLLDGLAAEWKQTASDEEFRYIKTAVDKYVTEDGAIQRDQQGQAFPADQHSLDDIELGRAVLVVYRVTHDERYAKAAKFLAGQLAVQPRTASGAYWHKQIYPDQVWLDGAYMAQPFRAAYAATFHQPADFDDIAKEFLLIFEHMRDPVTGLLRHGWDESKKMPWADKTTGLSPSVWGRAMGWYCMALVDVLDWIPEGNPQRAKLIDVLKKTMDAVVKYQDPATGLWWQVMDRGVAGFQQIEGSNGQRIEVMPAPPNGNFVEASASAMFVYALAKGVRRGYLPQTEQAAAKAGWDGIQRKFVKTDADGIVTLTGTVKVGGLGGTPYRSGTFAYYTSTEALGDNDAKGVGAYLLAGSEMQQAGAPTAKSK